MLRRWFLAFPLAGRARGAGKFSDELWVSIAALYAKTLRHPFLRGLQDGSLARARFQHYLVQDALYLGAFSKALQDLAARAPRSEWRDQFTRDATEAIAVEKQMHSEILASYGVQPDSAARMSNVNRAYTVHLLNACAREPFSAAVAAMLPCYWIYWEVGKQLKQRGSSDKDYQRWIDQYAGEEYGITVRRVIAILDEAVGQATPRERSRCRKLFRQSAEFEYDFWDSAWRSS
ncbi:MAG: thiaminase II [Bryobacterales bacterium]|nr:thiaminase II [Bryobacterales bacterium]